MASWVFLIVALALNAVANVLMKVGAKDQLPLAHGAGAAAKVAAFLNLATVCGIVLFAVNVLFYRRALDGISLSVAYPIMVGGGLVLVTLAACLLPRLAERIGFVQVLGMVLIALGAWLVTRPAPP